MPAVSGQPSTSTRHAPSYQPMVLCLLAFILGIGIDRLVDGEARVYFFLAVLAWVGWLVVTCWLQAGPNRGRSNRGRSGWRESWGSFFLLISLMGVGAFWHHGRWNWFGVHEIGRYASRKSQPVCLEGVVLSEPRWIAPNDSPDHLDGGPETTRTRATLRITRLRNGTEWESVSGKMDMVVHADCDHVRAGDGVRVFGRLVKIRPPTNPGQFDFRAHYRARGKLATLHVYHPESIEVIESAGGRQFRLLARLRQHLNDSIWQAIHDDEAAFAAAILLGNREQLSPQRREQFMETGTVHLLAISGLHVGILASTFFLFYRIGWLSRNHCLWATIGFVVFFAWLVEFRPPATRAAILIVLYCTGRLLGEKGFSYNLLAIAGGIVLLLNPSDLFGIGPQLSFLAVATLMFGKEWIFRPSSTDPIERLIASTRPVPVRFFNRLRRQVRIAFWVSGLIWFMAMPLVAYHFHLVAPIALVINPILLIPIAWALYGGLGVLVFGWFSSGMARMFGRFCEMNLWLIESWIGMAGALPFSHFWTAGPTLPALVLFYGGVFGVAVFPLTRLGGRWLTLWVLLWIVLGWIVPGQVMDAYRRTHPGPLVCTFIDVGHGSGVLVQLPNGKNLLYDAGSFGSSHYGFTNIAGVLWHERVARIDAVVLSHADVDHFNALYDLCDRFSVGVVYVPPSMLANDSNSVVSILERLDELGVPVKTCVAGEGLLPGSGATIDVLNPPVGGAGGSDNAESLVLLIEHAGKRILLTGDLEGPGLDRLLSRPPIDCALVMAPHHGSIHSDPEKLMRWSTPEIVVVSGSSHRILPEVIQIFEAGGRTVYRTDLHGAVRYRCDSHGATASHWDGSAFVAGVSVRPK